MGSGLFSHHCHSQPHHQTKDKTSKEDVATAVKECQGTPVTCTSVSHVLGMFAPYMGHRWTNSCKIQRNKRFLGHMVPQQVSEMMGSQDFGDGNLEARSQKLSTLAISGQQVKQKARYRVMPSFKDQSSWESGHQPQVQQRKVRARKKNTWPCSPMLLSLPAPVKETPKRWSSPLLSPSPPLPPHSLSFPSSISLPLSYTHAHIHTRSHTCIYAY